MSREGRGRQGSDYNEVLWDLRWTWREMKTRGEQLWKGGNINGLVVVVRLKTFWNQRTRWNEMDRSKVEARGRNWNVVGCGYLHEQDLWVAQVGWRTRRGGQEGERSGWGRILYMDLEITTHYDKRGACGRQWVWGQNLQRVKVSGSETFR